MKLEQIDPNFKISSAIPQDAELYSVLEIPHSVWGVRMENGKFRRMPENVAKSISTGVCCLHTNTAGGRLRFCTDSPWIGICAQVERPGKMPHFALTGSAGFDLYRRSGDLWQFTGTFIPEWEVDTMLQGVIPTEGGKTAEYLIHFPLYTDVKNLYICVQKDAVVRGGHPYGEFLPFVTYGSSITQGGCASRPGMSYQNILSRRFNIDHINLGFSGNARAESSMMAYIADLPMSLFILDYDFNAPSPEHLLATHENAYRTVREKNPQIPILMLSRPRCRLDREDTLRLEIIRRTYEKARERGDRNVYFIPGSELMRCCMDEGTVDHTHPTDLGFASMAQVIGEFIENLGIYKEEKSRINYEK